MYLSKWRFGRNRQHVRYAVDNIIAQARQPEIYVAGGVVDDVPGRVEAILLHLCLVVHALRGAPKAHSFIAELYRLIFRHHLDPAMRELAVGDLSVPKQMRRIAEGIHGRGIAYAEALTESQNMGNNILLAGALKRNFQMGEPPVWLADYTALQSQHLATIGPDNLMKAGWAFADKK